MSVLKTYTTNKLEIEKDGYFDNNTAIIENDKTPYHFYDTQTTGFGTVTYYLYQLDESKLKRGTISENLIDEFSGSITGTTVYLSSQAFASECVYRYIIYAQAPFGESVYYYTDIFYIKSITFRAVEKRKSGVLKVYKGDYFEFQKDGYFDNNTLLNYEYQIPGFNFDSELGISAISSSLMEIDRNKLKIKTISEVRIKSITASSSGQVIYYNNDYFAGEGIYRYKITVRPGIGADVDFYTDCFCVKSGDLDDVRQFVDDSYRQFAGGTYRVFID